MKQVFIVAAPRSGTTFLGELLNHHPDITNWHEPYFVWQFHIKNKPDDCLDNLDVTEKVRNFILNEFNIFSLRMKKPITLEKTPVNAFKIDFINEIFPDAHWIHLYRDGRAIISSLKQKYLHRNEISKNQNILKFFQDVTYTLKKQPLWRHRLLAILYELKTRNHLSPYLAKNLITFGPKYKNWEIDRMNFSDIEFMAKQWVESENNIQRSLNKIKSEQTFSLRYEDLIHQPEQAVENICQHLNIPFTPLIKHLSEIKRDSCDKWKGTLSKNELNLIQPIINDMQGKLGYT